MLVPRAIERKLRVVCSKLMQYSVSSAICSNEAAREETTAPGAGCVPNTMRPPRRVFLNLYYTLHRWFGLGLHPPGHDRRSDVQPLQGAAGGPTGAGYRPPAQRLPGLGWAAVAPRLGYAWRGKGGGCYGPGCRGGLFPAAESSNIPKGLFYLFPWWLRTWTMGGGLALPAFEGTLQYPML